MSLPAMTTALAAWVSLKMDWLLPLDHGTASSRSGTKVCGCCVIDPLYTAEDCIYIWLCFSPFFFFGCFFVFFFFFMIAIRCSVCCYAPPTNHPTLSRILGVRPSPPPPPPPPKTVLYYATGLALMHSHTHKLSGVHLKTSAYVNGLSIYF